ncbi:CYFA0S15e02784g1_1 [Cyberlindnera fabianii]|uniref:CYFA0S15e02784g1_1 n=1 Tax=Cyberlindnera fabianii TaxID=36022 RepID=A0A061B5R6_CYBFA|nr:CYFA0S15e02784g1_1 [Cyberlindnera fabianii]
MAITQPALAIPIPRHHNAPHKQLSTTPSLQSVLDQKRLSINQSLRLSLSSSSSSSSSDTEDSPSSPPISVHSLLSMDSLDPCSHKHPLDESQTDYLSDIDNDFFNDSTMLELVEPLPSDYTCPQDPLSPKAITKKQSFVSQLSNSLRNFTTSTKKQNNELVFDIQPRLTDDRLPIHVAYSTTTTSTTTHLQDRELETFKVTSLSHSHSTTSLPSSTAVYRNREPRVNSQFLRLYSHEAASRRKGLLLETDPIEEELYMPHPSHYHGTEREFALLVRHRLWNCVVLPPRQDAPMDPTTHNDEYVFDDEIHDKEEMTLVDTQRQVKPWITLEDETEKNTTLGPRGILDKGVQFTVKGWCNTRWMPSRDTQTN